MIPHLSHLPLHQKFDVTNKFYTFGYRYISVLLTLIIVKQYWVLCEFTGVGMTSPDPSQFYTSKDGVVYPMGKGVASTGYSSLLYNEYPYVNVLTIGDNTCDLMMGDVLGELCHVLSRCWGGYKWPRTLKINVTGISLQFTWIIECVMNRLTEERWWVIIPSWR